MNTPKVLMQSGIGDQTELMRHGIPVIQHLPGVGQNFQDHPAIWCVWEYPSFTPPNPTSESVMCWSGGNGSQGQDFFACQAAAPLGPPETIAKFGSPQSGWCFAAGITHPKSRGRVSLTGPNPFDPVRIEANILSDPDDLKAAIACVERLREVANSVPLRPFVKRGSCRVTSKVANWRALFAMRQRPIGTRHARPRWVETRCPLWTAD